MKTIIQRLNMNPSCKRAIHWGKIITITGSAQVVVQVLGFVSGILVIRLLPTHEYALYTLANTMLGSMSILADGGITNGVMSQGGLVWQDNKMLGKVLVTGLSLRRMFAVSSLIVATPILLYLLRHHEASWIMSFMILLSLVPAFFSTLNGSLLQIASKLRQDITPLQKNQVEVNSLRLAMLVITLFVFPWAFVAILASGLSQIWANFRLHQLTSQYVDWGQTPDSSIRKVLLSIVKRILPGAAYYCFSGQITIWLASAFNSTEAVAQIGALGRLAIVLSIINVLFGTLVAPRFARLPNNLNVLLKRYFQVLILLLSLCFFIMIIVWIFPSEVLWILGHKYAELKEELMLVMISSCLGLITGETFNLYSSRGWAINPIYLILVSTSAIVFGVALIDISSLKGILFFKIFIDTVSLIMHVLFGISKINRLKVKTVKV